MAKSFFGLRAVALLLVMVLFLAACGNSTTSSSGSSGSSQPSGSSSSSSTGTSQSSASSSSSSTGNSQGLTASGAGSTGSTGASGGSGASPTMGSSTPAAASSSSSTSGASSASWYPLKTSYKKIQGGGSTFDAPVFLAQFPQYQKANGTQVSYQQIGSGKGIAGFTNGTLDFGATDAPLQTDELKAVNGNVLEFPVVTGSIVVAYNLPSVKQQLKLTGQVVADMYLGKITKWNDPAIKKLNPGVELPDLSIAPAYRSDSSGTSFAFTSWLSTQSSEWKDKLGAGKDVKWPTGIGGEGNAGVANQVKQNQGSVGYIETAYAVPNHIAYAQIRNSAGSFTVPTKDNMTAAAKGGISKLDSRLTGSILNAPGQTSYPITSFSWIIIKKNFDSKQSEKAKALVNMIYWMITDGQKYVPTGYAPLPQTLVQKELQQLQQVQINGQAITQSG